MIYLIWSIPALVVVCLIASGRVGLSTASIAGTVSALAVSLLAAPRAYLAADAIVSIERGAWIGAIVVPYILGGLLFWRIALRQTDGATNDPGLLLAARTRRRTLFSACFLVGPFAESATGFGAGIFGAMAIIRGLGFSPASLRVFSLLSQTLIMWGAMGSGLIVAAAYANTDPTSLGLHCFPLVAALQIVWLPIYWRLASKAGVDGNAREMVSEATWLAVALLSVISATYLLGPEVAMLATYGPLIALRWFIDHKPDRAELRRTFNRMLPFSLLIGGLVLSRLYPPLNQFLQSAGRLQPFHDVPSWSPFFHAGSWLLIGALLVGAARRDPTGIRQEMVASWRIGRVAVLGVVQFSIMAEILSGSGIAGALAGGVYEAAGRWALLATPILSGMFGLLTNGGNAPNGLFMTSQISLARLAELSVPAVIALQHFSGSMTSMFSPVRMAIVCGLAGTPGHERAAYRDLLPHIAGLIVVLMGAALMICLRVI